MANIFSNPAAICTTAPPQASGPLRMHKVFIPWILPLLYFLFLTTPLSAQSNAFQRAYLEEKVRDPYIREFIEKEIEGTATAEELKAIKRYCAERENRKSAASLRSAGANDYLDEGAEPHIVLHPTNKNLMALAFMKLTATVAEYPVYISRDGGATWIKSTFNSETALDSVFPNGSVLGGGDPILAFDEDGTLHLSYIYIHGTFPSPLRGDMLYVYSLDTGRTFIVPPLDDHVIYGGDLFTSDLLDRQWMDVDNSGGPFDGNLYLSAFYFGGALNTIGQLLLTKDPDSSNFDLNNVTTAVAPPAGDLTQFGNVQVDQSGRIHITCAVADQIVGSGTVVHALSTDGGQTFGAPVQVGTGDILFPMTTGMGGNSVIHDRENAAISLAVDRNNVYVAWTDLGNDSSKAYFSYSHDGGANFSPQQEFGNQLVGTSDYHFLPNLAADSGRVTLSWYAVDKVTQLANYYVAESADSGLSFNAVFKISDTSSAFVGGPSVFYGDYNSSAKRGCSTFSVWSDGRSGTAGIYIARTELCDTSGIPLSAITELSPVSEDFQVGALWPNPSVSLANFSISLATPQGVTSEVFDVQGRLIQSFKHGFLSAGQHELNLDLRGLSRGRYMLKISSRSSPIFATRILVKK